MDVEEAPGPSDEISSPSAQQPQPSVNLGDNDIKGDLDNVNNDNGRAGSSYDYLNHGFSSEKWKIELNGLPKHFSYGQIKKLLNVHLKLDVHKIKQKGSKSTSVFLNFKSEEAKNLALKTLDGHKFKNNTLSAHHANPVRDPIQNRSKKEKGAIKSDKSLAEQIQEATSPWWNIPYDQQIEKKTVESRKILEELTKEIRKSGSSPESILLEPLVPSPLTIGYRNKCEFSIGYNPEDNLKTVGFRSTTYKDGGVHVGPIDHLSHLPPLMIKGALTFQTFIRSSAYEPYNFTEYSGVWKQLTVRTAKNDQILLFLTIDTKSLTSEAILHLRQEIIDYFTNPLTSGDLVVTSFYLKEAEKNGQKDKNQPELLFGKSHLFESLLGLEFRISPEAFFQVNTPAAEELYKVLRDQCGINEESTLLDICCGTGTIGICLAEKTQGVLGVELNGSAVSDAIYNASANGLEGKCEYFVGRAEDLVDILITRSKNKNIVAIVDPPRAGLQGRVLLELRNCVKIKRLIFVACDIRAASRNIVDLVRPSSKRLFGAPFTLTKIIPVDLFPNSPHIEMVLVLDRSSSS